VRAVTAVAAAVLVLAVGASSARGHADVVRLTPAAGSTSTTVRVVGVRFNDAIVTGTIRVATASGRTVMPRTSGVVSRGTYLRAVLRSALARGSYRVTWRARFQDGHRKEGSWTFRVR
jgi:methionine-rich copper-binding protein CopC